MTDLHTTPAPHRAERERDEADYDLLNDVYSLLRNEWAGCGRERGEGSHGEDLYQMSQRIAEELNRRLREKAEPQATGLREVHLAELEAAHKAVQKLGSILSSKPHSFGQVAFDRYFEWVQRVEKAHADIRDALDHAASQVQALEAVS